MLWGVIFVSANPTPFQENLPLISMKIGYDIIICNYIKINTTSGGIT